MAVRTKRRQPPPTRPAVLNQLIVARDQPELFLRLCRRIADCAIVTILLDRRQAERRQEAHSVPVERRRGERRSVPNPRNDLRRRRYIFARPQSRCPHD